MKKILSIILCVTMFLSMGTITYAKDTNSFDKAEQVTFYTESHIYNYQNSNLTSDTTQIDVQNGFKEAIHCYILPTDTTTEYKRPFGARPASTTNILQDCLTLNEFSITPHLSPYASWVYLDNLYTTYNQTTSYYCGPACVQSVLKYLTGNTYSQDTIAKGCNTSSSSGTEISSMVKYVNDAQSKHSYHSKYSASSTTFQNTLYSSIVADDAPPIIGLAFTTSDGWLYNTSGHYMSVYGVTTDASTFALSDPWIGYSSDLSSNPWCYAKSASTLYNAFNSSLAGLMY